MSVRGFLKPETEAYYRCPSDNIELTDAHRPYLNEEGIAEYERIRKKMEEPSFVLLGTCLRENGGWLHWHPDPRHQCYKSSDQNGGMYCSHLRYMNNGVVCTSAIIRYQCVIGDLIHVLTHDDGSGEMHYAFKKID